MSRKVHQTRSTKTQRGLKQDENEGTSELLNFLKQQSEYIDQIENENKFVKVSVAYSCKQSRLSINNALQDGHIFSTFFKDELSVFGKRLDNVVRENQKLHDAIRSNTVQDTIHRASIVAEDNQRVSGISQIVI